MRTYFVVLLVFADIKFNEVVPFATTTHAKKYAKMHKSYPGFVSGKIVKVANNRQPHN